MKGSARLAIRIEMRSAGRAPVAGPDLTRSPRQAGVGVVLLGVGQGGAGLHDLTRELARGVLRMDVDAHGRLFLLCGLEARMTYRRAAVQPRCAHEGEDKPA